MDWIQNPPPSSELADRDIKQTGTHLAGRRIALLITGSIAAYRTPDLIREVSTYIPGSEVIELPTAGHSPYFETPEAFNETIATFLTKHA